MHKQTVYILYIHNVKIQNPNSPNFTSNLSHVFVYITPVHCPSISKNVNSAFIEEQSLNAKIMTLEVMSKLHCL